MRKQRSIHDDLKLTLDVAWDGQAIDADDVYVCCESCFQNGEYEILCTNNDEIICRFTPLCLNGDDPNLGDFFDRLLNVVSKTGYGMPHVYNCDTD